MALSRKTTLQLARKLRDQRPNLEDDAAMQLWKRMVQAVAASVVAEQYVGEFADAAGYPVSTEKSLHGDAAA